METKFSYTKEMNINELLEYHKESVGKSKIYYSDRGSKVSVNEMGFRVLEAENNVIYFDELFEVEVTEEIKEDTILPVLIELTTGGNTYVRNFSTIKNIKSSSTKSIYARFGDDLKKVYEIEDN